MPDNTKPVQEKKEWRRLFPFDLLTKAEKIAKSSHVQELVTTPNTASAEIRNRNGQFFDVTLTAPKTIYDNWDDKKFYCSCLTKRKNFWWEDGRHHTAEVCQHEAAVLMVWEQEHGPWVFEEPPELAQARAREAEERRRARELEQQRRAEQARLQAEKEEKKSRKLGAVALFPGEDPKGSFYRLRHALRNMRTNEYAADRARALLTENAAVLENVRQDYASNGSPMLSARGSVRDGERFYNVQLNLLSDKLESCRCSCSSYYFYGYTGSELCEHELSLLAVLEDYIRRENPGDATDRAASSFLEAMDRLAAGQESEASEGTPRPKTIVLRPRLMLDDGALVLSYKLGSAGGKSALLRSYRDFLYSYEEHLAFRLSKTNVLDFGAFDLSDDSLPWLTFLQRRMSETDVANDSLSYYSGSLKVKTRDALAGAVLDRFYELAEGTMVAFAASGKKDERELSVGHAALRVALTTSRMPKDGPLMGIEVTGRMPVILNGSAGSYMLTADSLSKITKEEELVLRPFRAASDRTGNIRFHIGRDRLPEYYYRVVPQLRQSDCVDLEDGCAAEVEALLPPEPRFTFRLDIDGVYDIITCEALVRYGEDAPHTLPCPNRAGLYRDAVQEERVLQTLRAFFPKRLEASSLFWLPYSDDALYEIMTDAVPELSRFGAVEGSAAFDRSALRPMPQLRIGVSVESGLLEIGLLTKDMSPEELLAVLESYRQKKKYHRLRSGAFVDLDRDSQLSELMALGAGVDFSLEDAVNGTAKVPMYRALYLDALLEEHDSLSLNRDRTYRALIKNFKTIRDADYEVPDAQAEVLRPYQVHGYKWLRTLAAAGFGGILADEMGLGKTLQFISLVQALFDAGSMALCLVVCPASLVYNWQEEFRRFAPALNTQVMTGTAAQRKNRLSALPDGTVCITSYDLLRQDIAAYRELNFSLMVLDEAQYIKNQKASMTKAVKAVSARLRFALTGTPIENRLAELWSIFDFLMPGFLYSYAEFSDRLETPIVKQKDEDATAKLRRMTAPFILRRLKADVLKDLPPKLEEVRYTRFDDEQRKIYDGQIVRMKQLVVTSGSSGEDKLRIFAELTRIRQICCDPSLLLENYHGGSAKRAACLELVQSAMGGGHRMLVFSQFTSMLALLEEDLNAAGIPYFKLTGATPKEQRLRLVRAFNEGDTPVFLISLKAGGTGLNLTGADVVIHYDPWWNLAAQNQATDRAHRIGQQNQVTVYRIIVKDTIEERILAMQEAKRDLAEAVLSGEGTSLASLSQEELLELLG